MPRDAVMDKKMFKAEKNPSTPAGDARTTCTSLLVKFLSPVMLIIIDVDGRKIMLDVKCFAAVL